MPQIGPNTLQLLIKAFQTANGLVSDGIIGPKTQWVINIQLKEGEDGQFQGARLLSGVSAWGQPKIVSGFKTLNPSRPTHNGVDVFFKYHVGMGDVPVGDGEAAGRKGVPKWYVPPGTLALSAAEGTVTRVVLLKTGICIVVKHTSGYVSKYMHLTSALVSEGNTVWLNQALGDVGDNPVDNDARHLHFEIHQYGLPVDPQNLLSKEFSL